MIAIANEDLQLEINPQGAEILSIYSKKNKLNYIWDANPAFWPKSSPVLFPIVGGVKNDTYQAEGKEFTIGRHGFARPSMFEITTAKETRATFTLRTSEETLKQYPYKFRFSVTYQIEANTLITSYEVYNDDDKTIYFSFGGHPAFRVPLTEGTEFSDYYLYFSEEESASIYPIGKDGAIEKTPVPFIDGKQKLPLSKALFYNDALVFKHLKSDKIKLISDKTSHGLSMDIKEFPYLGIWQAKDANFVCIEPWAGLGEVEGDDGALQHKEGIMALNPKGSIKKTWRAEFF